MSRNGSKSKIIKRAAPTAKDLEIIVPAIYEAAKQDKYGFALRAQMNLIFSRYQYSQYRDDEYIDFAAHKDIKDQDDVIVKKLAGDTALLLAVKDENLDAVKLLVGEGASVNKKNFWYGRSPLHYAAANGDLEIVKTLINKGANTTSKDEKGLTPLDYALEYENPDIAELIKNIKPQTSLNPIQEPTRSETSSTPPKENSPETSPNLQQPPRRSTQRVQNRTGCCVIL